MKRPIWVWAVWCLLLLVALGYVATSVEAYKTVTYICENTGSRFGYRLWPGGFKTGSWARTSALENYLAGHMKGPVEHRWSRCAYMGTTVLGNHISFSDGPVGGLVQLRDEDLQVWVAHHGQSEIVGLYEFLRKADYAESEKRAEAMEEELRQYGRVE